MAASGGSEKRVGEGEGEEGEGGEEEEEEEDLAFERGDERSALCCLYRGARGAGWKKADGWTTDRPLGEWYGVTVEHGHVVGLNLESNNLDGRLPCQALAQLLHLPTAPARRTCRT